MVYIQYFLYFNHFEHLKMYLCKHHLHGKEWWWWRRLTHSRRQPPLYFVMKPIQKCLNPALLLLTNRGRLHWLQKEVSLYESQCKSDSTSNLIYELS